MFSQVSIIHGLGVFLRGALFKQKSVSVEELSADSCPQKFDVLKDVRTQKFPRTDFFKKAIWCNLWSPQNEAISLVTMPSKELRLVEKNHPTVKPDLGVASHEMKTYSESRIELQNLQTLKKMLEKLSQFLSSE